MVHSGIVQVHQMMILRSLAFVLNLHARHLDKPLPTAIQMHLLPRAKCDLSNLEYFREWILILSFHSSDF